MAQLIPVAQKNVRLQNKRMLTQSNQWLAAQELASIQMKYADDGRTLNEAVLCGAKDFVEWQHYPSNDLVDKSTGYEFYYHAHSADDRVPGEHGHFHVIKRENDSFQHLIGIALDQKGLPVRLFTTNQWVTGEEIVEARLVMHAIKGFEMTVMGRMAPVSKWIRAFMRLFYSEIEDLVMKRDKKILQLESSLGSKDLALNARSHHVLTECKIDLISRLSEKLLAVN